MSEARETVGRAKARRTPERAGRKPGAQRTSASEGGGRHAAFAGSVNISEAARRRTIEYGRLVGLTCRHGGGMRPLE